MGYHLIGRLQDSARRAIVLLELHRGGIGVILFEFQDVADVSTAPRVDGLIIVSYHHDIAALCCEELGDGVLSVIRVLVFVH